MVLDRSCGYFSIPSDLRTKWNHKQAAPSAKITSFAKTGEPRPAGTNSQDFI